MRMVGMLIHQLQRKGELGKFIFSHHFEVANGAQKDLLGSKGMTRLIRLKTLIGLKKV